MEDFSTLRTVTWSGRSVKMIDQTLLPSKLAYRTVRRHREVAEAIRSMVVRGAPAIGVAAAMGVALAALESKAKDKQQFMKDIEEAATTLRSTRPTAVNLFWGVDRALQAARRESSPADAKAAIVAEVKVMEEQDVATNRKLGRIGAQLIDDGDTILTQCNAGALATVGYGTALGVVRAAREQGKSVKVIVPETRPALQGARLTAFELLRDGFDCRLIPDTAVGFVLASGEVDKVVVGADRITKDGWVFNKIGTYSIAVLAKRHGVPFIPAAPKSTFDLLRTHGQIVVEERAASEVTEIRGRRIAPKGIPVGNPAFDATPPSLVTSIVSDAGLVRQPIAQNISKVIA